MEVIYRDSCLCKIVIFNAHLIENVGRYILNLHGFRFHKDFGVLNVEQTIRKENTLLCILISQFS